MTKVEILPLLQKLYFIAVEDISQLAEPMIKLLRQGVVDECLALNNVNLAAMLAEDWPEDFEELKSNLPPWTIITCVAGYQRRPEERLSIQERYLKSICEEFGFKPQPTLRGAEGKEDIILKLLSNPWNKEPYWKLCYKSSCHDIFFLSTLSKVLSLLAS
jgi:DNA-binding NtrC family response regulator